MHSRAAASKSLVAQLAAVADFCTNTIACCILSQLLLHLLQQLASSRVVRRMSNVALYSVTRSNKPEDLFADAWDAVVELTEKAESAGCAVPDSDDDDDLVQASVFIIALAF
jgi:hypothetical protein